MFVHLSLSRELVDRLHELNIKVFLISGGFRCIVEHVATQLNIPLNHVYANRLKFYFNGKSQQRAVCDVLLFSHEWKSRLNPLSGSLNIHSRPLGLIQVRSFDCLN